VQLKGRRVWLIGASGGIGRALAYDLAREGAVLALSSRRLDLLEATAAAAARVGTPPIVKQLDVTDAEAIRRVHADLVEAWGRIDVLFYNAGIWLQVPVTNFDPVKAVLQVEVNLNGMMRAVATVLPDMIAQRDGDIIGVASLAGYRGYFRGTTYSASKAGAIALLQGLRLELEPYNVGVTMVNPGFHDTALLAENDFRMPFMGDAESASRMIVRGLLKGEPEIHFPKRLSWPLKLATALPRPLYEAFARRFE
jgi:short-subunit dehydrogenase